MKQEFLREVQRAGWKISHVSEQHVTTACPREGCSVLVTFKEGAPIIQACAKGGGLEDILVSTFEDARIHLRARREGLGLTLREVEEMSGCATDHLAKAEKDSPTKYPNTQLLIEWAKALGYDLILRPSVMPEMSLRYLAQSRSKVAARVRMQPHHRQRRSDVEKSSQVPE